MPMPQTVKIKLDVTTFYSSLGLTSNAADSEIQKSYRKLARELHPDKSKSDSAAELFKVINNAYSTLTDKDKRKRYDATLLSKGLTNYKPKDGYHKHEGHISSDSSHNIKTPQKNKVPNTFYHRPYEQQPYGFGTNNDKPNNSSHSKVPIFQSFNLKNYQRTQRSPHREETEEEKTNSMSENAKKTPPSHSNTFKDSKEKRNGFNDQATGDVNDVNEDGVRSKLHKTNESDPFEHLSGSPFANNRHRHFARTKHEARAQERRSVSPVKNTPNTEEADMSESWDSLKNILNHFKEDKTSIPNKNGIEKVSDSSIKATKVRRAESQSIKLDDLNKSLPADNDFFDMRKVSDTLKTVPVIKKPKVSPPEELVEIQMESPNLKATEIYHNSNINTATTQIPTNLEENLYMPVNQPLPKIYKPEIIPLHQYRIDSKVIESELPMIPHLQYNTLNKSELERCKQLVSEFNTQANLLKHKLLSTLTERLQADKNLDEKLLKFENTSNWVSCKDFDNEIVLKLGELNNRQMIVAQKFSNLLNSLYGVNQQSF